ncbi:MAG: S8 family serine peptidase [Prolixibacteraceae bacterium]|nr:S8 family serine peptidase [Prolixibacteraceae bacterium]
MRRIIIYIVFTVLSLTGLGAKAQLYYRVAFSDKKNTPWRLSDPNAYLSERALIRREKQNILIDSLDLPVDPVYIKKVTDLGCTLVHLSKWMNSVTVKAEDDDIMDNIKQLPFVREVELTKSYMINKRAGNKLTDPISPGKLLEIDTTLYGQSSGQVNQLNGQFLHNQGYRGEGIQIAILDAGFYKVDEYPAFDSLWTENRILGIKDFVDSSEDIFEMHYHGMSVLSIMAGNFPGKLVGTAPEASYLLIRSEDINTEFITEEDNWIAAAEYADSAGVDIINSSLGYFTFDDSNMNHTYADMDGNTTRVTKAANIAVSRGILVFASAGNEGRDNQGWKYIIAPSDGDSVIAVGAVNKEGVPAPFTSYGPASDGDIKPNVAAVGWNTVIQKHDGTIGTGNGTSYSSPVIAGITACLWEANPGATAWQVKKALEQSSHLYNNPDSLVGYGIPDMQIADYILKANVVKQWEYNTLWMVYPNPATDYIIMRKLSKEINKKIRISFYQTDGKLIWQEIRNDATKIMLQNLNILKPGFYLMQIVSENQVETIKIKKN